MVVLLEDMMTIAEHHLVALGEHARVREQRQFLQLALEDKKRSEVERILRRRVLACVSGTDPDRDLAAEVFLLERPTGWQRKARVSGAAVVSTAPWLHPGQGAAGVARARLTPAAGMEVASQNPGI